MFSNSLFLDLFNKLFARVQNSRFAMWCRDSLVFSHIDTLIWVVFILTVLSTCKCQSGIIGGLSLFFALLNLARLALKPGESVKISKLDVILIIYFLFIFVSLMGSSLFVLSFKGFLKNVVYFLFYFCAVYFFRDNKKKIFPTLLLIGAIMSYESIVAVFQHFNKVEALAGWVDTSTMTSEKQLISRSFGTLNPSNPNLLGGYLIAGLSSVFTCFAFYFTSKNRKRSLFWALCFVLNLIAIIFTGCRGAYLGLLAFFLVLAFGVNFYVKRAFGGFSNIKKRYKNLLAGLLALGAAVIVLTPSISHRFISIFQFRGDSSISFRMNVYEAAWKMFQDNPFLGIGLGNVNFREIYGLYMKTGFDALGSYCVFLEVAVESGIFALIAFTLFVVLASYQGFKIFLDDKCPKDLRLLAFGTALTVIATMAHGLFDTVWFRPQVQIIFWTNIAILNSFLIKNTIRQNLKLVKS